MRRLVRFLLYKPIVIAFDVLLVNFGFLLAFLLLWNHLLTRSTNLSAYRHLGVLISVTTLITFHLLDLYRDWLRRSLRHVIYSVIIAVGMTMLATMALGFWSREFAFPRSVLAAACLIQIVLISAYRMQMRRVYRRWFGNRRTLVIGESTESAWNVAHKFLEHNVGLYSVEGCLAREELRPPHAELENAETVVLTPSLQEKDDIILYCFRHNKEVLVVPNLSELTIFGAEAREVDDLLIFGIQPHRLNPAETLLKRSFDVIVSAGLLIVTSPVLATVSILIPMTSRGPVLFRQERIGKGGRPFRVLKFRTMVMDAEKLSGPVLASERDPRITSLGRFLRAIRIDELPQMLNVIKGEMSLIGPRPERTYFVEQFEKELPAYELRHAVKPGVTGLAQVMGTYGTSVERKLHFDLLYIYNYSLLLDLKILMQTVRVVLQGEEAFRQATRKAPLARRAPSMLVERLRASEEAIERNGSQSD